VLTVSLLLLDEKSSGSTCSQDKANKRNPAGGEFDKLYLHTGFLKCYALILLPVFSLCLYQNKALKSKVTSHTKQVDKLENQVIRGLLLFRSIGLTIYTDI